jgi:hypothetical protein
VILQLEHLLSAAIYGGVLHLACAGCLRLLANDAQSVSYNSYEAVVMFQVLMCYMAGFLHPYEALPR